MTGRDLLQRSILPEECLVGFGIPTSERPFRETRGKRGSYFAKKFITCGEYEHRFLDPYRAATRSMARSGARIEPELSLNRLGEAFRSPEIQVVILFSHWEDGSIELSGRLATPDEIVAALPAGTAKIVDLTVCGSQPLADALVRQRPDCTIRYGLKEGEAEGATLTPAFWLVLLRTFFLILKKGPLTYGQAWTKLAEAGRLHVVRRRK